MVQAHACTAGLSVETMHFDTCNCTTMFISMLCVTVVEKEDVMLSCLCC